MRLRIGLAVCLGFLLPFTRAWVGDVNGDGAQTYSRTRMSLGGGAHWVGAVDVNGDGICDLVVQRNRSIAAYLNEKGKGFSIANQSSVELPDDAFLFQFVDVDGDKRHELAYMHPAGASCLAFADGKFERAPRQLVSRSTLFKGKCTGRPIQKDFLRRVDGDELPDLVLPVENGFSIFLAAREGEYEHRVSIEIPPSGRGQFAGGVQRERRLFLSALQDRIVVSQSCPASELGDFDGDGLRELAVYRDGLLTVYRLFGDKTGESIGSYTIDAHALRRKKRERMFSFDVPPYVGDVNGDGLADVVRTTTGEGKTVVFLCKQGQERFGEPDCVIKVDGWTVRTWPTDLDGDARRDIVLAKVEKLGVWSAIQVLVTKTVDVDLYVYMCDGAGHFSDVPSYSRTLTVPLVMAFTSQSIRLETPLILDFDGDLNGDGRNDLLVKTANDRLSVFSGEKDRTFAANASCELEMMDTSAFSSSEVLLNDLNGDGRLDIALCHKDFENRTNWIELFMSR